MRLCQIFIISLMILMASSCKVEYDIRKPFSVMSEVPKLIPYQSTSFAGSNFPGVAEDYKIYFGDLEVPVTKVSPDSISIFVPFEASIGEWDVDLIYKGEKTKFGRVEILDWKAVLPESVTFFQTDDEEYPFHITDQLSNSIVPHVSNGIIDKLYVNSVTGVKSVLELNENGLPAFYYNEKESVVFDGYDLEKGTVNIARFPAGQIDSISYEYAVKLDMAAVETLEGLKSGRLNGDDTQQALAIVGTVFSITACIVSAAGLLVPPFTFLAAAGASLTCGSAAYDAVKILNPEADQTVVSTVQTVHGIKMNLINCLSLAAKPKNAKDLYDGIDGCVGLAVEAAKAGDVLYTEYIKSIERDRQRIKDILRTGYGDIKITLEWDNETDIDLWVVEPNGTKIYFEEPYSLTQGQLDLDNTDGYGPENVFWPTDMAPLGNYKVQVHYYGPEGGPAARYLVNIVNFGRPKSFRGAISYNQVVTIAEFKTGAEWKLSGERISGKVELADRSTLPIKKSSAK